MSTNGMEPEPDRRKRYRSRNRTYVLPKDVLEGERLDLQHHMFRYALQGDFVAPIQQDVSKILDVGSGTGIWGEEMALDFPKARVINLDLEAAERTLRSRQLTDRPPNWHFVQGNLLDGLPFPDDFFDFTHQRAMAVSIPAVRWPSVLTELIRVTRPGGWIELLEPGSTFQNTGPVTTKLWGWILEAVSRRGLNVKGLEELGALAERAGMRTVQTRYLDIPLGAWDPYLGVLMEKDLMQAFETVEPIVCAGLNIARAAYVDALLAAAQEWKDNRMTFRFCLVHGQA